MRQAAVAAGAYFDNPEALLVGIPKPVSELPRATWERLPRLLRSAGAFFVQKCHEKLQRFKGTHRTLR